MIGIVGGVGPLAGIDLYKKIIEHTAASVEQDHIPVLLASFPDQIPSRPDFLLGKTTVNPGPAIARVILLLEQAGARHIGIACNTAHAPLIFDAMQAALEAAHSQVQIVHMIDHTIQALLAHRHGIQRVGVLCTSGSYQTQLFQNKLRQAGLEPVMLEFERHESLIQAAISTIKTAGLDFGQTPIDQLNSAIREMKTLGAQSVLIGCTELGMIDHLLDFKGLTAINPSVVLARTLIQASYPDKLRAVFD